LCYSDYGANEWITSWENGIVVDTKEEAFDAIKKLKENPELLKKLSVNAIKLGKRFDWKNLIDSWEKEIERIYNS
jgi:glycosyltransferase involved in cell wall biosynthesis